MRCRGEHCSPVLGVCCKFRIVGDDTLGVPLEGVRFVFFLQAMQGDKGCRGVGTSRAPSPTNALCGYSGLL